MLQRCHSSSAPAPAGSIQSRSPNTLVTASPRRAATRADRQRQRDHEPVVGVDEPELEEEQLGEVGGVGRRRRRSSSGRPRTPTSAGSACRRRRPDAAACVRVIVRADRRRAGAPASRVRRRVDVERVPVEVPPVVLLGDVAPSRRSPTGAEHAKRYSSRGGSQAFSPPAGWSNSRSNQATNASAAASSAGLSAVERPRIAVVGACRPGPPSGARTGAAVHRAARRPPRTPATPRGGRRPPRRRRLGIGRRERGSASMNRPRVVADAGDQLQPVAPHQQPQVERDVAPARRSGTGGARPCASSGSVVVEGCGRRRRRAGTCVSASWSSCSCAEHRRARRRRRGTRRAATAASASRAASRTSARSARSKSTRARPPLEPVPDRDRREPPLARAPRAMSSTGSGQPSRSAMNSQHAVVARRGWSRSRCRAASPPSSSPAGTARTRVASTWPGSTARFRARSSVSCSAPTRSSQCQPPSARRA